MRVLWRRIRRGAVADAAGEQPPVAPGRAQIVLHNDDTTPMDFVVVDVLEGVLGIEKTDSVDLMLRVHWRGAAGCGDFDPIEAQAKRDAIEALARAKGYPLVCTVVTGAAPSETG